MKQRQVYVHSTPKCEDEKPLVGWLLYFATYADDDGWQEPAAFIEGEDGKVFSVDPTQLVFTKPHSSKDDKHDVYVSALKQRLLDYNSNEGLIMHALACILNPGNDAITAEAIVGALYKRVEVK